MNVEANHTESHVDKEKKTALIVFTGGAVGFKESIAQLKKMVQANWKLKVALSISAEYIYSIDDLKKELDIEEIYLESENMGLSPLYEGVPIIIMPTLTANTVAKIANGITDNMTTNLISHALMYNIPVVAARDASDLSLQDQAGIASIAYKELSAAHLVTIERFGIQLVKANELYQAVEENMVRAHSKDSIAQNVFSKNLLSRADILKYKGMVGELKIAGNTIVTPLAQEAAKDLGINIVRIDQQTRNQSTDETKDFEMKIYTRTGDKGKTSLIGGRVYKDDIRVEAYGTIDELNGFVGKAITELSKDQFSDIIDDLEKIQHELFDCGGDIASVVKERKNKLTEETVNYLEEKIDKYSGETPEIERFILPGGSKASATIHIARTVARRAERLIVALMKEENAPSPTVLQYLNRLSDYFFVAARLVNFRLNIPDVEYIRSAKVFHLTPDSNK